jgi:O-antigen/teichoic acid export membrane protein
LIMIPAIIMVPIYPALSRLYSQTKEKFEQLSQNSFIYILLINFPITVLVFIFAPQIIRLSYGESEYLQAIPAFQILVWVLPFSSLTAVLGSMLAATNKQMKTTKNAAICAGLNIALNLVMIPKLSIIGAAISTLITEAVLVFLNWKIMSVHLHSRSFALFMKKFTLLILFIAILYLFFVQFGIQIYWIAAFVMAAFLGGVLVLGLVEKNLKSVIPRI